MAAITIQFAKAVRRRRKQLGWSQEKLAEVSGLHSTFIGRVERATQDISLTNVGRLAKALKIKPGKLLGR